MRELHITITCDRCGHVIEEDEAELITVSTSNGTYETDYCGDCMTVWIGEMRPAKKGRARGNRPQQEPQLPCPHCDRKFGSQRGLTKHLQAMHPKG